MKEMKILLDFNITKNTHTMYNSSFKMPPKGISYFKSEFKGINNQTYSNLGKIRKNLIKIIPPLRKLDPFILSVLRKEPRDVDLIHFIFHLGKTNKTAVIDYEHAYSFIDWNNLKRNKNEKKKAIRILNRGNIKYLLAMNKESLKSFQLFFGKKVKIPQEVIYPAVSIPKEMKKINGKKKKIVFMSTSNILNNKIFLIKGGLETLKAFEALAEKYPSYDFIMLGKVPKEFEKKFPKNLSIKGTISQENAWKELREAQIFVQPSYQAPTMAFLEAMSFKLPIITTPFWGNLEYVNEDNGIIINTLPLNHIDNNNVPLYPPEILKKIIKNAPENAKKIEQAIEKLIKNPVLRKKLGERGFRIVEKGKFSIEKKNKKLLRIYEEALKK